jgi:hypothetical protein
VARGARAPRFVRLLLDAHYPKGIAEQLWPLGHDVISIHERPGLKGLLDDEPSPPLAAEQRAIMTEDWGRPQPADDAGRRRRDDAPRRPLHVAETTPAQPPHGRALRARPRRLPPTPSRPGRDSEQLPLAVRPADLIASQMISPSEAHPASAKHATRGPGVGPARPGHLAEMAFLEGKPPAVRLARDDGVRGSSRLLTQTPCTARPSCARRPPWAGPQRAPEQRLGQQAGSPDSPARRQRVGLPDGLLHCHAPPVRPVRRVYLRRCAAADRPAE